MAKKPRWVNPEEMIRIWMEDFGYTASTLASGQAHDQQGAEFQPSLSLTMTRKFSRLPKMSDKYKDPIWI